MASITLRSDKGSPLTNAEVDSNFSNLNTELGQKESASNKGIAGGYASLDAGGKVPSTQLPSYVDDVVEAATFLSLPSPGETGKIYVVLDSNKSYRWSGSAYIEIASSPGSTDAISEGSANLYFTNARARAAVDAAGSLSYNVATGIFSYTQPTNVSAFTNDSGYLTGITGTQVTTALGYTPYNSSNPSGYITSAALSSYLPLSGGTMSGAILLGSGIPIRDVSGEWILGKNSAEISIGSAAVANGIAFNSASNSTFTYRSQQILHAGNYNSYALPLSGGTLTGELSVNEAWGAGSFTEQFRIYGTYPSMTFRSTTSDTGWLVHTQSDGGLTYYSINGALTDNWTQRMTLLTNGELRKGGASGDLYIHSGNYSSYALPLSGGTLTGTLYFADTTNGIYKAGGRLTVRSESTDDVANFASYGLYLPKTGQTAGLYVQSPIEARGGLRIGDGAGSGTITVGADTAATANRLVQRDSGGDIYGRYYFGVHFNQSSSNTENPSIAAFWTNSGSDNYNRKSSPAHVISQLGLLTTSNYSSYALPLSGGTLTGNLTMSSGGIGSNAWSAASANETSRILAPAGAAASWDNNPVGAIKIRLPFRYNNAMWRMTVKIYDYGASVSEYHIGTYSYADGGYQSAAYFIGSNYAPVRNVRFGNDGSYDCVWIGETNTVWSYPVVAVTDFSSGFRTSAASNFMNNWHISYVTSFGTVAQNLNPVVRLASGSHVDGNTILHAGNYTSYSPSLTGSGASGTWGIRITGFANQGSPRLYSTDASYNYDAANPYFGYLTYNGSANRWRFKVSPATPDAVEVAYADVAGSATSATSASNSTTVGGLAPAQFFNNMGNDHGTYTDFNNVPGFGAYYVQQGGNSPTGTADHQWYGFTLGLGNNYAYSSYASQLYWPRRAQNGETYIYVRDREGGTWNGWTKIRAGVADSATSLNFGGGYTVQMGDWGLRNTTPYGWIQLGPANASWAHIYADRTFYFNQELYVNNSQVLHAGNYTSYSPSLTGSGASGTWGINITGNADTVDSLHASSFSRKDTTNQWIKPYYEYGSYLTSETPANLRDQMGGGGLRVDFLHPSYTGSGGWNHVITWSGYNIYNMYQLGGHYDGGTGTDLWVRSEANHTGTSWTAWRKLLNSSNYNSYAPSLTGSGASGTWSINITGSAGSASSASSASSATALGSSGYGSNNHTWRQESGTFAGYSGWASYMINNHGDGATYYNQTLIMPFWSAPQYSRLEGGTFRGPYTILSTENYTSYSPSLTGSGASGTWGISISGTAARATRANGNFYIDDNYGNGVVGVYASTRYQGVFFMGDSYKMSADGTSLANMYGIGWSHPNAGGAAGNLTDHGMLIINNGSFRCAISNSIVASGNITAYSDERLKKNWRDMPENFVERLAQVRNGCYERIDDGIDQVGVSAQSLQKLLPEAILTAKDEIGTLSVSYGNAAMASAVELAKELVMLKKELAELKSRLH